jgi:AraC-like DNA-binding protein
MVSVRCKMLVKEELQKMGLHYIIVELGEVEIMEDLAYEEREQLKKNLMYWGLELIDDRKSILIEKIKTTILEMVHYSDEFPKTKTSAYLSEKLNYDYAYISSLFSEVKGMTIGQFIILNKIERVKELLMYDELTLTQIADKINYSSVAHLSNQFKKVTGLSPSHFKQLLHHRRQPLDGLENRQNKAETEV